MIASDVMAEQFNNKFLDFDYKFYEETIQNRQRNSAGHYKASDLIIEIATLASFFASQDTQSKLSHIEVAYCAFLGWQISFHQKLKSDTHSKNEKIIKRYAKSALKTFKKTNPSIQVNELAWVIFCCAMIREKFYSEFKYSMSAFMADPVDDEHIIRIAYQIQK